MRFRVLIPVFVVVLAAVAGSAAPAPAAPHEQKATTLSSAADAYVNAAARRRNFGRARTLLVRGRPAARAYVRFDLRGVSGTVTRATLRIYARSRSAPGFNVRTTGSGWSERKITFANAPRPGATVAALRAVQRPGWQVIDVTRAVHVGSTASFALTTGRSSLLLASRESGAKRPQLVVEETPPETLLAAGDIADCDDSTGDQQTAALLDQLPGTVAALGDLAYEDGTAAEFANCYARAWGRAYARTRPAPGNHEYQTPGAAGYFGYWGSIAGDPAKGYYSYDLGFIGGCGAGSAQETWLRADLTAHPARCTLAYWHHPRFSGGFVGGDAMLAPIWQALYANNADLVLTAHAHNYQRFAPMTAAGILDRSRGIREFVVGTGGASHHPGGQVANLEVFNDTTYGVIKLTLRTTGYDWQFVPVAGGTFTDSGSTACH